MGSINKTELEQAMLYFDELGVSAYIDDGSLYITVECADDQDVQVSPSEVSYRADLWRASHGH